MKFSKLKNVGYYPGDRGAIVLFHGFPSESQLEQVDEKNSDLAMDLNQKGFEVYIISYEGLGKNRDGKFLFSKTITDSIDLISEILKYRDTVTIIGHSWGGFIAMIINSVFGSKISRSILLSPFCFLPSSDHLKKIISDIMVDVPYLIKDDINVDSLVIDLIETDRAYFNNKNTIIGNLKNTTLFHAENDKEIPLESSLEILKINPSVKLIICNTDHSFKENRGMVLDLISGVVCV